MVREKNGRKKICDNITHGKMLSFSTSNGKIEFYVIETVKSLRFFRSYILFSTR